MSIQQCLFNEYLWLYLQTITHEIGHNLNMKHDFYCKPSTPNPACDRFCATDPSQTCTGIGSNMDYYEVSLMIISKISPTKLF